MAATETQTIESLAGTPNSLAPHYRRFRVGERLLLSGHSHQAWPDVAREGLVESFDDAALEVDEKWARAEAKAERVRDGYRSLLGDPGGEIALAASTHELVVRWLSALDLEAKPRLVTTAGEFHAIRRQLARLAEWGLEIHHEPAEPVETLAERLARTIDGRTAAVLVSAVYFETARIVPGLDRLAAACERSGVPFLVDAYHALGALPFRLAERGLESALVTGGGYKYLQLGEGNAFLRLPKGLNLRPVITGWFAEFGTKSGPKSWDRVDFLPGAGAFGGATYDPASSYRGARVFDFFDQQRLTPELLRAVSRHQIDRLAARFDALDLPESIVTRERSVPLSERGAFLALEAPRAIELQQALLVRGVFTDARGRFLRVGPAPYLSDLQLDTAIDALAEAARDLG